MRQAPSKTNRQYEPPASLLESILLCAKTQGMDQAQLAHKAGISPETVSRVKRRGTMDLSSLVALADAVDMAVVVKPKAGVRPHVPAAQAAQTVRNATVAQNPPHPLADPKWGLAWSNPNASKTSLVRNALQRGNYDAVLEAALIEGVDYVRTQLQAISESMQPKFLADLNRMLSNIEKGFERAAS